MSDRHPKRSRCRSCGEVTRIAPTYFQLLKQIRHLRYYEPRSAQFCIPCRQAWLEPTQLELPFDLNDQVEALPARAPVYIGRGVSLKEEGAAAETVPLWASWPKSSRQAWLDQARSRLVWDGGADL